MIKETILKFNGKTVLSKLSKLSATTPAAKVALESVMEHLRAKPVYATDIIAMMQALESAGFDPALNKAKTALKAECTKERIHVAIAFESLANKTTKSFFDVGVEAQNALANLYNLNSTLIVDTIANGSLDEWKFNPVIAQLISMAKAAKLSSKNVGRAQIIANDDKFGLNTSVVPMIRLAYVSESDSIVFIDGMFFNQGKNGGLTSLNLSDVRGFMTGPMNAMLTALTDYFVSDKQEPTKLVPNSRGSELLAAVGISGLSINMTKGSEPLLVNGRGFYLDTFKQFFSVSNNDFVVASTTMPGFRTEIAKLLSGIEALTNNRDYLAESFVSKLTREDSENSEASAIYLGNSKDRFLVINRMHGTVTDVSTYDNAYALLSSETLITNTEAHAFAQSLFTEDLTKEASQYNAKKHLAEQLSLELSDFKALRSKINEDLVKLTDMPDGNTEKITELSELLERVDDSISKTEQSITNLTD